MKMPLEGMGIIHIKGVNAVTAKGRRYYYHRSTGQRIKAQYGSRAFLDEVKAWDAIVEAKTPSPGTWGLLASKYLESRTFSELAERTQKDYRDRVLSYLSVINDLPLHKITTPEVHKLREETYKNRGRWLANNVVAVMSAVFSWGKPLGYCADNPAAGIKRIRKPKGAARANRPWTDDEINAVLNHANPQLTLLIKILLYTALRSVDVVEHLKWSHYKDGLFNFRPSKNDFDLWIAPSPSLRAAIASAKPKTSIMIVTNQAGEPWRMDSMRSAWGRLNRKLLKEGLVLPGLTLHGIRHTVGNHLADDGFDTATIALILGHKTESQAKKYSNRARRKDAGRKAAASISNIGFAKDVNKKRTNDDVLQKD